MQRVIGTVIGKLLQALLRLGRTSGQALPGLVVEKLCPDYLRIMAGQLPDGIVLITGTNGKTTTTKMVVELLQAAGKNVITNRTGSNLTRGLVASFAGRANWSGRLRGDLAVFEVDEAFAVQLIGQVKPQWVLALNVSRDQLDRFGEVDSVASLLGTVMRSAEVGVVTSANDPRLSAIARGLEVTTRYFAVAPSLRHFFPTDNELVSVTADASVDLPESQLEHPDIELTHFEGKSATYRVGDMLLKTELQVTGQHNFQNAAAALELVHCLLPDRPLEQLADDLSKVSIAFGRGEIYRLPTGTVQLVLVKNPPSFRQALASYPTAGPRTMIVINDNYADSRDVSWLWDVDFDIFSGTEIALASGSRAYDIALRLAYSRANVLATDPDIMNALSIFCRKSGDKVIFATYTAMLALHDRLTRLQKEAARD